MRTTHFAAAATALALMTASASAQNLVPATPAGSSALQDGLFRASDIADSRVYALSREGGITWEDDTVYTAIDPDWEDLGEIQDVVLDAGGQMVGVLAEVGGWLGIGERDVLLPAADLRALRLDDRIVYVTRMSENQLEALPELNKEYWGRN